MKLMRSLDWARIRSKNPKLQHTLITRHRKRRLRQCPQRSRSPSRLRREAMTGDRTVIGIETGTEIEDAIVREKVAETGAGTEIETVAADRRDETRYDETDRHGGPGMRGAAADQDQVRTEGRRCRRRISCLLLDSMTQGHRRPLKIVDLSPPRSRFLPPGSRSDRLLARPPRQVGMTAPEEMIVARDLLNELGVRVAALLMTSPVGVLAAAHRTLQRKYRERVWEVVFRARCLELVCRHPKAPVGRTHTIPNLPRDAARRIGGSHHTTAGLPKMWSVFSLSKFLSCLGGRI
mmetsp:Transcript_314/g.614  ORF Transcript_314/g.614 Transcript_314/m.614 type:complete len:292 (+) Transcript_314:179-1054(+)